MLESGTWLMHLELSLLDAWCLLNAQHMLEVWRQLSRPGIIDIKAFKFLPQADVENICFRSISIRMDKNMDVH